VRVGPGKAVGGEAAGGGKGAGGWECIRTSCEGVGWSWLSWEHSTMCSEGDWCMGQASKQCWSHGKCAQGCKVWASALLSSYGHGPA